jgi:hypothetical protein
MTDKTCPWCDAPNAHHVLETETGPVTVCYACKNDYNAWLREQLYSRAEYAYDEPYYADTMSGGCIEL